MSPDIRIDGVDCGQFHGRLIVDDQVITVGENDHVEVTNLPGGIALVQTPSLTAYADTVYCEQVAR